MSLNIFRQDSKKLFFFTHSVSAKPQQRPKNRQLALLMTNFGKEIIAASWQVISKNFFYVLCLNFIYIDPTSDCYLCKFFLQIVSKLKERGYALNFGIQK
jgi:hypothetical protein